MSETSHGTIQGTSQGAQAQRTPRLRLMRGEGHGPSEQVEDPAGAERPALRLIDEGAPLMIVGADPARRAALRHQLTHTMPAGTFFEELTTLSQVLDRAPLSRMVILSGRLEDISARSLMRILGQRYPRLPVVSLDGAGQDDL